PTIAAILLLKTIFEAQPPLRKQTRILAQDPLAILGVYAAPPEIRTIEIFLGFVPKQVLHVWADERRRVIAGRLEAVDHGRRASEPTLRALPGRRGGPFGALALTDVAPGSNDLGRLTIIVTDQPLCVIHPAIASVLAKEAIFDRVAALLKQLH